jgi:hypothetical protein
MDAVFSVAKQLQRHRDKVNGINIQTGYKESMNK